MKKKLSTLLLSVLVLGVLAIPVNSIVAPTGGNVFHTLVEWADPSAS